MYKEMSFEEWYAIVKLKFAQRGLLPPEDIELMELAHMECRADEKSIEDFIKEYESQY